MAKKTYSPDYIYSEYVDKVQPRIKEIEYMIFEGKTFSEIADELGVSNSLLWAMRTSQTFTDLREVFTPRRMEIIQTENVENALYRKAIGFFYEEQQAIKVKREYFNKMEKKCTQEDVKIVTIRKYMPPDFNAQRFYLLNKNSQDYHPENQRPEDNSTEMLINNVKNMVIRVRELANESAPKQEESKDAQ